MVRMDRETRDRLQAESKKRGRSLSETGFLVIREHLGLPVADAPGGQLGEEIASIKAQLDEFRRVTALPPEIQRIVDDQRRMQEQIDRIIGTKRK